MRIVKLKSLRVSAVAIVIAVANIGCDSNGQIPTPAPDLGSQNTRPAPIEEIDRADGGKNFARADGWPIPSFDGAEREEFETSITSGEGRSVKVYRTVIRTDPLSLIFDNPLHLIGIGHKKVRINTVKEYRTPEGVFCYKFLVNNADIDESTNEIRSSQRVLYPYSYYDEDGDGVFESLVISEKDPQGRQGFEREPHLPKWASAKTK